MGLSAKILPNYTYDDYVKWEGEWEVIEGIPYAMSPMVSPRHQAITGKIHAEFLSEVRKNSCSCEVYQPIDVKIAENTIVHPDILIVFKPIEKQYLDFPPELVVEILSPSSQLKDKVTKLELYQDFGISYYLIVDPENNAISYYQRTEEGVYQEIDKIEEFKLTDTCSIKPDFTRIWD